MVGLKSLGKIDEPEAPQRDRIFPVCSNPTEGADNHELAVKFGSSSKNFHINPTPVFPLSPEFTGEIFAVTLKTLLQMLGKEITVISCYKIEYRF
jgi:hypothetical protein